MINFRVVKVSSFVKVLIKMSLFVFIVIGIVRTFNFLNKLNLDSAVEKKLKKVDNKTFLECIDNNVNFNVMKKKQKSKNIIASQLGFISALKMDEDVEPETVESNFVEEVNSKNVEENTDLKNVTTEVVAENNKKDTYTNVSGSVQIRNETSFNLTEDMIIPNIDFNNKKDIVIFHTHTCESYTPSEKYNYVQTGNFRTTDLNFSVARVGDELAGRLSEKGFNVIHDKTYHDYPEYTGSYTRSLSTVKEILSDTKADLVIDLHRDAMGDCSYGPRVKIGDEYASQIMFVMGSSEGGLEHPNWNENLKLAIKIQQKGNEMYPGLFKPIMLTKYRYNQSTARGACIIEVGATGNTLDESINSMKYLAEVLGEVMK